MNRAILFFCLILCYPIWSTAQKQKKTDKAILANLESHIRFLADDKLEGRRAGTAGENAASTYIVTEFEKIGLRSAVQNNWLQSFEINDGKEIESSTLFVINGHTLTQGTEYFPFPYSALNEVTGAPAIALQESGMPWFVDLREILDTNQNNPHFDINTALHEKIKECIAQGATAVVFFNTSNSADNIAFDPKDRSAAVSIPVLYVITDAARKYFKDESATMEVKIHVNIKESKRTGHNVIGYLDNGAAETVVIGAHYDHLGYGEDGNSLYRGKEKLIHNGADDNASGTAALIELARLLKQSQTKKHNYLFIAFSGEELGLFGSKYFVEHPTTELTRIAYMINMDMVGRLNDSSHALTVGGFGTSTDWAEALPAANNKKYFILKYDSSGTGPSDHTSFYRKDIPVLFFFTGIHSDYHKPTDDYEKINYTGELQVVKYVFAVVEHVDKNSRPAFVKTREVQNGNAPRFSVTLGIMPDYTFSGTGVRVDGVSDGRPAQKAGLITGDIIIQLGDYPVSSLENYMQALSKFKKGDSATVKYNRGNEAKQAEISF